MAYSLYFYPQAEAKVRYTVFFSDEDSLSSKKKTENQMGRYGRRLDIEWAYDVKFNVMNGQILSREYHCDVIGGIGHKTCKFKGNHDPITDRPILYTITNNNVFSDRPQSPYGDPNGKPIFLTPSVEIHSPDARESVIFNQPELIQMSDEELLRENKLHARATEYLYFRLRGFLNHGGFWIGVRDKSGNEYWSGNKDKDAILEKIGEGLWMQESYVAIQIPPTLKEDLIEKRETLSILFKPKNRSGIQFDMKEVDAHLMNLSSSGRYEVLPLSGRIDCTITNRVDSCVVL